MAGKLGQEWFDELFSRVSVEDIISERVPLTRKGRKLWACCPFHNEKTPSFSVDPEAGLYYCFGCHKGGNAMTFLVDYDHMEKGEALEYLAERAHMKLPERDRFEKTPDVSAELKDKIYQCNTFAARYFHNLIWQPQGSEALKYLYGRGLTDADIRHFGLGASPQRGKELYDALRAEGFEDAVIKQAWLSGEGENGVYDMFRNRVMFPIIDIRGRVIAFGGRVMGKGEPKYLNTSDTPVFSKRNGVYGLNFTKGVSRLQRLILVEGYMDTVMLLKQGIPGVVATLGTALTEEQIRLMKRYVHEIWISYDGDAAGQKAAMRALDMFEPSGLDVRVISYPGNMDPDEYIKAYGRDAWEALPKYKPNAYRMQRAEDGLDLTTQAGLTEYTLKCCRILKTEKSAVELENYLRQLSAKTGYEREVLLRQMGQSVPEASQAPRTAAPPVQRRAPSRRDSAQMQLIALLAKELIPINLVSKAEFDNEIYAEIYECLAQGLKPRDFIEDFPDEQKGAALEALSYQPLPEDREKALALAGELIGTIRKARTEARIQALEEKLKTATGSERDRLNAELLKLLQQ